MNRDQSAKSKDRRDGNPHGLKIETQLSRKGPTMGNLAPISGSFNSAAPTMSSREIAELCDKRHDHILRDIEKMLQDIDAPKFGVVDFVAEYTDAKGEKRKEYRLPKDLTVTLITGYRADLRYRVVKRLEELEATPRAPQIDVRNASQLTQIAIQLIEVNQEQAKQIDSMRGDVQAFDRIAKADGSFNITEAAKSLQIRPKDLFDWLAHHGWIYKRAGSQGWLGYQTKCNQGLMEHKSTTVTRADGTEKITEQVRITAKGLAVLAKLIFPTVALIGGAA